MSDETLKGDNIKLHKSEIPIVKQHYTGDSDLKHNPNFFLSNIIHYNLSLY